MVQSGHIGSSCLLGGLKLLRTVSSVAKTPLSALSASKTAVWGDESKFGVLAQLQSANLGSQMVRFANSGQKTSGFTHLGARYEFFKDLELDERVSDFIADQNYNSNIKLDTQKVMRLVSSLQLDGLENNFVTTLSNGQFRRCRIARELYRSKGLLLIDDPLLGLDPRSGEVVSEVLHGVSGDSQPLVIGLRIQDEIPDWIQWIKIVKDGEVILEGPSDDADVLETVNEIKSNFHLKHNQMVQNIRAKFKPMAHDNVSNGTPIIEMDNVNVQYKGKPAIKDFSWSVKEGEKWHIRGKNGSGKTTLLSLITLDHPQAWNKSIKFLGIPRKVGKVNYFDTNSLIGFTSPELHALFPKKLSAKDSVSTGYVVGSFIPPEIDAAQEETVLHYLEIMNVDPQTQFGKLPLSQQKMVLLIRALISKPKVLILDEALSGMTDEDIIRGKFLIDTWPGTCLIIGHVKEEVPSCDKFLLVDEINQGKVQYGDVV